MIINSIRIIKDSQNESNIAERIRYINRNINSFVEIRLFELKWKNTHSMRTL